MQILRTIGILAVMMSVGLFGVSAFTGCEQEPDNGVHIDTDENGVEIDADAPGDD